MSELNATRPDLAAVIDRSDPRFPYFVRLCARFSRIKPGAELDRTELTSLWEAAERARSIELRTTRAADGVMLKRNYNVGGSVVYYVALGDLIKIGTTRNLLSRMTHVNPTRILGLESGDATLERARHHQFGHLREHSEWFRSAPDLLSHIGSLPDGWRQVRDDMTLVTIASAARLARVHVATIYRWIEAGQIGRYGGKVDQAEVENRVARREPTAS